MDRQINKQRGQTKPGLLSRLPRTATSVSFALLSSMQILWCGERFHQRTRFEIPRGDKLAEDVIVGFV